MIERISLAIATSLLGASAAFAEIGPGEAFRHIGETGTVCGTVASAHYASRSRGQPTFLDMGSAYPNEPFTALIWGEDRGKFGLPEMLAGHKLCVTGQISEYRGRPEIVVRNPSQISE